ncbi:hypothetical protein METBISCDRAFT_21395 [Metschnikowia bicuspidata]|uniref:Zn(2)-C6 fungal-type domain-containing protein n=1 Tax=Metschnikowia bicuspidata TaxID=27322 RepID=A0A4P9ZH13_9ASCO|nr:hypothetical protein METBISCDRAFT_21395 [Metschnikowia bicuspidata]
MYSDLAEYSIMMNGEKAVTHIPSHYATQEFHGKSERVTLPPISGFFSLTEHTLKLLNFQSLVGLVSATPSLTSSSLAEELLLNSPSLNNSEMFAPSIPEAAHSLISMASSPVCTPEAAETEEASGKKRRQRLGPSCDHCRARKVKCNADVVMLSRFFDPAELGAQLKDEYFLTAEQKVQLSSGAEVHITHNHVLVVSNQKLIRFLPCSSCRTKSFTCCFSKGFTKEDVIHSKKRETSHGSAGDKTQNINRVAKKLSFPAPTNMRVAGGEMRLPVLMANASFSEVTFSPSGAGIIRKSSCTVCRKRKIKCVLSSHLTKCMGCIKKDCLCSFEL